MVKCLGKNQLNQQKVTDKIILDWIENFDNNRREMVQIMPKKEQDDPRYRIYWINGICRGTKIHKETVRKSLERLIESGKIWEWPKSKNGRYFQLCFRGWKKEFKNKFKSKVATSIRIPRDTSRERTEMIKKIRKYEREFKIIATQKQIRKSQNFLKNHEEMEYIDYILKILSSKN